MWCFTSVTFAFMSLTVCENIRRMWESTVLLSGVFSENKRKSLILYVRGQTALRVRWVFMCNRVTFAKLKTQRKLRTRWRMNQVIGDESISILTSAGFFLHTLQNEAFFLDVSQRCTHSDEQRHPGGGLRGGRCGAGAGRSVRLAQYCRPAAVRSHVLGY